MKNKKILIIAILAILCISVCIPVFASEAPGDNARTAPGENARTTTGEEAEPEGEPVPINETEGTPVEDDGHNHEENSNVREDDLYVASTDASYNMDQMVDGNVFITGKNVTITGQINGSLFVFTDKLVIEENAWIACHTFVCAGEVIIKGQMADLYAACGNLTIAETAEISRDVKAGAKDINLAGKIGRNVSLGADKVKVPDEAGKLSIYGNLKYEASEKIANLKEESVMGETKFIQGRNVPEETAGEIAIRYAMSAVRTVIFDIVIFIAIIFLAPKFLKKTKEYASSRGALAFAIGIAFTIAVPVISFVLILTDVGASLAGFALLAYFTMFMLNASIVSITANEFIADKLKLSEDNLKKGLLLIPVSLVIWGLRKLPVVGGWISVIVFLCGIGIMVLYQIDKRKEEKTEE